MNPLWRGSLWTWAVVGGLSLVVAADGGCFKASDTFVNYERSTTVGTTGAGGGGGSVGAQSARDFFEQNVKDQLIANCSGSDCHSSGVRAFLLLGQEYAAITTYRTSVGVPLIVDPAGSSQLILYPAGEEHPGKSWEGIEDVRDLALEWLTLEASDIEIEDIKQLGPVTPQGLTVLPMDSLAPELAGFTLSFYAIVYDGTVLELTDISVWPPNERGLKIVDPIWVVQTGSGGEILDNSQVGDHTFVAPNAVTLASGDLLITDWGPGYQLSVRFKSLQVLFADEEGNTFAPCSQPDLFSDGVAALPVQAQTNDVNGLLYCAEQCHGGAAGGQPTDKMNLSSLLSNPRNELLACARVREHIVGTQPDQSSIITLTDPGGGSPHPFSFGGNSSSHAKFRDAMAPWINAEGAEQ